MRKQHGLPDGRMSIGLRRRMKERIVSMLQSSR
jgi:hypothetical protein